MRGGINSAVYVRNHGSGSQKTIISRFLDTNGDGTGSINANGDYSSAAGIFYIQPSINENYRIARMLVSIEDTAGMQADEYGNIGSALTNGITLRKQNDLGTIVDYTDSNPVKTNSQWGGFCYDVDLKTWGAGNELIVVRWTFTRAGQFIRLSGQDSERLEIVVNDNLTGLVSHKFLAQGYIE